MARNNRKFLFATALPVFVMPIMLPWPELAEWRQSFYSMVNGTQSSQSSHPIYNTGIVSRGDISRQVTGAGVVRPLVSVLVGSQLSGQIVEIKASFNTEVKAGDILAVLDDKMFVSRVTQGQAELAVAQSALQNQRAAVKKAEALLQQAEQSLERQQVLTRTNSTTRTLLDTAVKDVLVAKAEIAIGEAQVASALASIRHREALLAQAQIDLDRTRIRAPIAGIILSRMVEVGQTVAASLQSPELFRIARDLKRIQIEAQVSEADIGGVQKANAVTFGVDAYPDMEFNGRVAEIRLAPAVEQNIVTYTVVIDVDNPELRLFPGMTANVRIETARRENVVRIPVEALRYRPQDVSTTGKSKDPRDKNIWVLEANGRAEPRAVRIGVSDGTNVEITGGGVTHGSKVIIKQHSSSKE
jgi:HlyD family secretion protein